MAYQSLYRRYRSGRFDALVGQQHIVTALKNAISEERVGHAYLFSGPRGTGKTSTARILGKALNCTSLEQDGEPCCQCDSCLSFAEGTSYDLHELDAASNNGVEAIRDLISKVALGSPGRTKIYILDEVHMLTPGAENALLKTLEEPPGHVVFVLATTEPQKVVSTIRSRTQHYEFELIPSDLLGSHLRWIAQDANLNVTDQMIDYVLRIGGGSARDALSALDQVVAAGGIPNDDDAVGAILEGISIGDPNTAIDGLSQAIQTGRAPRVIGETLISRLRDAFLTSMGASVEYLSDRQADQAKQLSERMPLATITKSLEAIGAALIGMRQSSDPRIDLEVAVLRLTHPKLQTDLGAIIGRLERLERQLEENEVLVSEGQAISQSPPTENELPKQEVQVEAQPVVTPIEDEIQSIATGSTTLREIENAWPDIKKGLSGKAKARFSGGQFLSFDSGNLVFSLPNEIHRDRCAECAGEVEESLKVHFHTKISVQLVVDSGKTPTTQIDAQEAQDSSLSTGDDEDMDFSELVEADPTAGDGFSLVAEKFPGAKIVEDV
jgi:DNA polymerase-3 subunit gamma/tau